MAALDVDLDLADLAAPFIGGLAGSLLGSALFPGYGYGYGGYGGMVDIHLVDIDLVVIHMGVSIWWFHHMAITGLIENEKTHDNRNGTSCVF